MLKYVSCDYDEEHKVKFSFDQTQEQLSSIQATSNFIQAANQQVRGSEFIN